MDKDDLETFHVQLSQVEAALEADPNNAELKSLAGELKQLIELTNNAVAQQAAAAKPDQSTSSSSRKAATTGGAGAARTWDAGDECLAKYSTDSNWYPARITSVGGAADNRVYSIVFDGYKTSELVNASEIKPRPSSHQAGGAILHSELSKRKRTKEEDVEREKKKKKNERKLEHKAAKAKEQTEKQASWQKFAKKAEKKGVHIAGVAGTSIFKTPENPLGKVGVTGSGKGMTTNSQRPSHRFTHDGVQS